MKKLSFKEKLEIVRNIIRESLSGNAAFALLVYSLLHSLPIKTFADLFVTILLFIAIIAVVIWLFLIIYVYFCELFRSHWIAVWFILWSVVINWICPYISRHLLSLNPLQARCRRYSRGER
ncbi:TPA: toxin ArtA [Escherichia coli]